MTRDKNHVIKVREKKYSKKRLIGCAHKHLNNDQDAKENREKVEKIESKKPLSRSWNLNFF